jgi:hypothetical protein
MKYRIALTLLSLVSTSSYSYQLHCEDANVPNSMKTVFVNEEKVRVPEKKVDCNNKQKIVDALNRANEDITKHFEYCQPEKKVYYNDQLCDSKGATALPDSVVKQMKLNILQNCNRPLRILYGGCLGQEMSPEALRLLGK